MELKITQESFDSSFRGEYKGYHIDTRLLRHPQDTSAIFIKLRNYISSFSKLINPITMAFDMFDTVVYLNEQIQKMYIRRQMERDFNHIRNIRETNAEKENIIHIMKRMTDDIITLLYVYYDSSNIAENGKIKISSIGDLYRNKGVDEKVINSIKDDLNYEKYKHIINTINDLHNSYKHSCLIQHSQWVHAVEGEAFYAYYAKNNNLNDIKYLCHNAQHIIIGYSDFLLEFFNVEKTDREHKIVYEYETAIV